MSWRASVAGASAVLVAAAAVLVVDAQHPTPATPKARSEQRPVTSATLSCPGAAAGAGAQTAVFAVGPGGPRPASGGSRLRLADSTSSLAATADVGVPLVARLDDGAGRSGVRVTARGALAPGVAAAQLSSYTARTAAGIAASWCLSPRDEWWFSGVDTSVGTTTGLVLSNPSRAVAVVDLHILGATGPVDAAGANGIAVAPRSRVLLDLARYAPGRAAITLHVAATRGTVAAAVSTTRLDGITPVGAEWLPSSAAPATSVVVGAGAAGLGRQSLVVTNTGTRQQLVTVRILDADGAFTSTALPELQVPPESVVVEDVSAILQRQSTAVQLSAHGPVTGSLVSEQVDSPHDYAVSTTSAPLSTPAVVPDVQQTELTLAFATASPAPERVEIRGVGPSGRRTGAETLVVSGTSTTAWAPPPAWEAAYLLVIVRPGSDVQAVASYRGERGVAQLPVLSGRLTVTRPAVLP